MLTEKRSGGVGVFCMGRSIGTLIPYTVHAFLAGDILIDTGTIYAQSEFARALQGRNISAIINTHHHEDHIGNNRFFQLNFNAPIYAPRDALPYLENPSTLGLHLYQKFVWNRPEPSRATPLNACFTSGDHTFEVIPTPGHCPDHVCLFEPGKKWLFAGDIYCGRVVRYLRADEDFHAPLSSLKKIATLDTGTLFCCLKGAIPQGKAALTDKIGYMEELAGKVMNLHTRGMSARTIRKRLLGREGAMFYLSGGHFAKQHIVDSILSDSQ